MKVTGESNMLFWSFLGFRLGKWLFSAKIQVEGMGSGEKAFRGPSEGPERGFMAKEPGPNGATKSVESTPLVTPVLVPIEGTAKAEPSPEWTEQELLEWAASKWQQGIKLGRGSVLSYWDCGYAISIAHKKFVEAHGKKGGWKARVKKVFGPYETAHQLELCAERVSRQAALMFCTSLEELKIKAEVIKCTVEIIPEKENGPDPAPRPQKRRGKPKPAEQEDQEQDQEEDQEQEEKDCSYHLLFALPERHGFSGPFSSEQVLREKIAQLLQEGKEALKPGGKVEINVTIISSKHDGA
jgi:hypothetical protein